MKVWRRCENWYSKWDNDLTLNIRITRSPCGRSFHSWSSARMISRLRRLCLDECQDQNWYVAFINNQCISRQLIFFLLQIRSNCSGPSHFQIIMKYLLIINLREKTIQIINYQIFSHIIEMLKRIGCSSNLF